MPDSWGDVRVSDPRAAERPAKPGAPGRAPGSDGLMGHPGNERPLMLLYAREAHAVALAHG